jgi:hypothetical protein
MPQFRAKPVVVEAQRFGGAPTEALERWLGPAFESWLPSRRQVAFQTPSGEQIASAGDWIVQSVGGRFFVCDPVRFAKTYAPEPEA